MRLEVELFTWMTLRLLSFFKKNKTQKTKARKDLAQHFKTFTWDP